MSKRARPDDDDDEPELARVARARIEQAGVLDSFDLPSEMREIILKYASAFTTDEEPFYFTNALNPRMLKRRIAITRARVGIATILFQTNDRDKKKTEIVLTRMGVKRPQLIDMLEFNIYEGRLDLVYQLLQPSIFHQPLPYTPAIARAYLPSFSFKYTAGNNAVDAKRHNRIQKVMRNLYIYYPRSQTVIDALWKRIVSREDGPDSYSSSEEDEDAVVDAFYDLVFNKKSPLRQSESAFKRAFGLDGPDKSWEDIVKLEPAHGPLPVPGDYRAPNARFAVYTHYIDQQYSFNTQRVKEKLPALTGFQFLQAFSFFFQTESDVLRAVQRDMDDVYYDPSSAHPFVDAVLDVTTNANSPLRTDPFRFNQAFNLAGRPMPWTALMAAEAEANKVMLVVNDEWSRDRMTIAAALSPYHQGGTSYREYMDALHTLGITLLHSTLAELQVVDREASDFPLWGPEVELLTGLPAAPDDQDRVFKHMKISPDLIIGRRCSFVSVAPTTVQWAFRYAANSDDIYYSITTGLWIYCYRPSLFPIFATCDMTKPFISYYVFMRCLMFPTRGLMTFLCTHTTPSDDFMQHWEYYALRTGLYSVFNDLVAEFGLQRGDGPRQMDAFHQMVSQESVFVSLTADDARAATDDDFLRVVIDDRHVAQCFPVYLNDMAMPRRLEAAIGLEDTVDMFLRMYLRGMIALDRSDMDVVRAFFELAVKRFQLSVTPLRTPRDIVGNLSDYRCFLNSTDALMRAEHIRVAAFFADIFQNDDPLARFTYLRASDAVFYHTSRARTKEDHFVDLHSLSVALSMGDTANAKHRACMRELMRTIHADVLVAFEHRPRTKFMHKLFDAIDKVKAQLDAKKEEDGI